ncbi:MAG: hypothetical protein NTV05_17070 [Acidobacteria bacterium]|nr:hypothetical protein [Acidobacteriota bacterium]
MVATVLTAGIVLRQNMILDASLAEMRKQSVAAQASVGAAQDAARAAKNSAALAERQVEYGAIEANAAKTQVALTEDSLRARLAITKYELQPLVIGERPRLQVEVENVGHSAAIDQRSAFFSMRLPALLMSDIGKKPHSEIMAGIRAEPWFLYIVTRPKTLNDLQLAQLPYLPPNAEFSLPERTEAGGLEPGAKSIHMSLYAKPLTEGLLKEIQDNARRPVFFGHFSYASFGKRHVTRFCAYTLPPGGEIATLSGQPLIACGGKWNLSE